VIPKENLNYSAEGVGIMPKDSQVDPKEVRLRKSNGNTPLTRESAKNSNSTIKKQSANRQDV
jgi:hypothetical protein